MSGIIAPVAGAKPGQPTLRKAAKSKMSAPTAATGLGERGPKLQYLAIPPSAWQPMMWGTRTGVTASTVSFNQVVAPVMLPDGATIQELSCFGRFAKDNVGEAIRLRAMPHDATNGGPILAKAIIGGASAQVQRAEVKLDHQVDNFANAYQIDAAFNGSPELRSCRIGYAL